ncbi:NUDIX hydrolase [Bifidobacterium callimiconis]|uniref:NTP pyrophosphohydrolase n=1 Tax=Bifidobacterium callimiconis TaxID=2306973 RepID=A0A430F835_9BIFI|nr:NUDIX hydrolase [Bifidobacterium callimiconis]MBT1177118.1 NUDIX hydrolase [Bifidobacterium callimiconis]RSX49016.1 NTP pyrophosphohydrolase [Bifidobacterium callimiconis]
MSDSVIDRLEASDDIDMETAPVVESSETVYTGAIFHVEDQTIRLTRRDGPSTHIRRQVMRHAPCVVMLVHDCATDRYLLEREYRVGPNKYAFGVPAGLIDGDEEPHAAALRELREETGVRPGLAEDGENDGDIVIDDVAQCYSSEGMTDELANIMVLHLRRWHMGERHFDKDEHVESAWVSWDELLSAGIISSNATIALKHEALRRALNKPCDGAGRN